MEMQWLGKRKMNNSSRRHESDGGQRGERRSTKQVPERSK